MVKRSRLEMYFDVLKAIDEGIHKPATILHRTHLSWTPLCKVFDTLVNRGFVREEKKARSKRYYITEKGKPALSYHRKALEGFIHSG
jgi:predicted transcriptional regulator